MRLRQSGIDMDSKKIDEAMRLKLPVKYNGEKYDRIIEYISRYDDNCRRMLSVGLLKGTSLFRVPADKVEVWDE